MQAGIQGVIGGITIDKYIINIKYINRIRIRIRIEYIIRIRYINRIRIRIEYINIIRIDNWT